MIGKLKRVLKSEFTKWVVIAMTGTFIGNYLANKPIRELEKRVKLEIHNQQEIKQTLESSTIDNLVTANKKTKIFNLLPEPVQDTLEPEQLTEEKIIEFQKEKVLPKRKVAKAKREAPKFRFLDDSYFTLVLAQSMNQNKSIKIDFLRAGKGLLDNLKQEKINYKTTGLELYQADKTLKADGINLGIDFSAIKSIARSGNVTQVYIKEPFRQNIADALDSKIDIYSSFKIRDYGHGENIKAKFEYNKAKFIYSKSARRGSGLKGWFTKDIAYDCFIDALEIKKNKKGHSILYLTGRVAEPGKDFNSPYQIQFNTTTKGKLSFKGRIIEDLNVYKRIVGSGYEKRLSIIKEAA